MPGNFKNIDIRVQKTKEALIEAMSRLLELRNFDKISVNDLCEEAQIGRTTFYSHFQDKYDFLAYWLSQVKASIISDEAANQDIRKRINDFSDRNDRIIRHLVDGANAETLGLLCDFILSLLDMDVPDSRKVNPEYAVLSQFCCGGIMNYFQWQATKKSKIDSKILNSYFYDILKTLHKWNVGHE